MSIPLLSGVALVHARATLIMVGVIWFVQVVHYLVVAYVGVDGFALYEAAHSRLTTWVVGPQMLVERATAMALIWTRPKGVSAVLTWLGFALLALVWLSTALLQVGQHNVLAKGFDGRTHRALVASNWIRTIAWSVRGLIVLGMVAAVMR